MLSCIHQQGQESLLLTEIFSPYYFRGVGQGVKGGGGGGGELNTTIGLEKRKLDTMFLLGYRRKSWTGF